ncbi:hypothetical protein BHE74_00054026 [Ensete ventricosum]|nr:hypothetical protein BHE74_00054026 [Ensete ventricosum]RZS18031.1 hypothetical protein BHM03_00050253 [Ensete ventricosum]
MNTVCECTNLPILARGIFKSSRIVYINTLSSLPIGLLYLCSLMVVLILPDPIID